MHVQFEFTQEDSIDATQRFLARSEIVRSWRLKGMLFTAVLAWLLVFIVFLRASMPVYGVVFGLTAAVISGLIYPSLYKSGVERRLRKLHEEKFGASDIFICEVEITPIGVWVRQTNKQITYEWESVEEIKETEDSLDIFTRDGGGVIVRKRAFASAAEQRQFKELAQSYLELCRIGNPEAAPQLTSHSSGLPDSSSFKHDE
jgi:hypothetical protein